MPLAEPTLPALANPFLRYALATRLAFLSITLFAVLLGIATAAASGIPVSWPLAALTVILALTTHAAINVLNDYYDDLNGTDAANSERVYPYTGGSRFIQNGVLTRADMLEYGLWLAAVVIVAGLGLSGVAGTGLIPIGATGLLIGWAYSAPPLRLNSRGWGEASVALGFALIAVGADYVQRRAFSALPATAAGGYALLVAAILYINQFPDRKADALAGKRHWVVRLGAARARWGYAALVLAAYTWPVLAVAAGRLPATALVALAPAALSWRATRLLWRHAAQPERLAPAIKLTIAAATAHGALLAAALWVWGLGRGPLGNIMA